MRISVNDGDVVRIYACTKHSYIQNNKISQNEYFRTKFDNVFTEYKVEFSLFYIFSQQHPFSK